MSRAGPDGACVIWKRRTRYSWQKLTTSLYEAPRLADVDGHGRLHEKGNDREVSGRHRSKPKGGNKSENEPKKQRLCVGGGWMCRVLI